MPVVQTDELSFHNGEVKMHELLHVPDRDNPTSDFLSPGAGYMVMHSPLLALGTTDQHGRIWTSIYGGEAGFARPIAESVIGVKTAVDRTYDPVIEALLGPNASVGEVVKANGPKKVISGLAIDLENRKRVKIAGSFIAGAIQEAEISNGPLEVQMAINIDESLGKWKFYLSFSKSVN
jgi:hypothetical protein